MTIDGSARAAREQAEPLVEQPRDLRRPYGGDAGSRELDCQRHAVETLADLRDRIDRRRVEHELWTRRARSIQEQPHSLRLGNLFEPGRRPGESQRAERPRLLTINRKEFSARREHLDARGRPREVVRQRRRSGYEMLAVVQDEKQLLRSQVLADALGHRQALAGVDAERRRDDLLKRGGICDSGEFAEPYAVAEAR